MQKTAAGKMRGRMRIILFLFVLCGFAVILGRLFLIQVVHGETYQQAAIQQQTRAVNLGAKRGTIYDRNGTILAQSASVWNVCISPAELEAEKLERTATALAEILNVDREKIIEESKDKKSFYRVIARRVDRGLYNEVTEYINQYDVKGVFFEEDTKRYYPYGNLASTVIGFTNYDNQGAYGLESYYDKVLSGTPGMVVSAKNAWGNDMHFKYQQQYPAKDGNSIVLTIDESIQHILERNLETAIVEHSIGNRASGVVLDVKTGEILAMATKPDFDPNDPYTLSDPRAQAELDAYVEGSKEYKEKKQDLQYEQWRNKSISDPYEPGSVFKIVTAAAALDTNSVGLGDHFFCDGSYTVSDRDIDCWKAGGHGSQNFTQAIQNSCNPAFIMIGQRLGAPLFYEYIQEFGLGETTGVDLPGEANSILQSYENLNKPGRVELASTSFGQTFKVTPIQLVTATSAAVNGGNLMQPYIVKQVLDGEGNVVETTQPVVKRQVISSETSKTMQQLVEAVVEEGSGSKAAIPGYRIGGKTGTSEKLDLKPLDKHILSFVGFAPMEDPQIAVLVMLDEPYLTDAFGSVIAAPVVGAVLQEVLPYMNIDPQYTEAELMEREMNTPDLRGLKPHDAQAELTAMGLKTRIVGSGSAVIQQIPQARAKILTGGTVVLYTEDEVIDTEIEVPDIVGMNAQEANRMIVEKGLNIELRGIITDGVATIVGEQWPLPGAQAKTGDIVIVTLREKPAEEEPAVEME